MFNTSIITGKWAKKIPKRSYRKFHNIILYNIDLHIDVKTKCVNVV